jgi:hypothetical protein
LDGDVDGVSQDDYSDWSEGSETAAGWSET